MNQRGKQLFAQLFSTNYNIFLDMGQDADQAMESAIEMSRQALTKQGLVSEEILDIWAVELYKKHNVGIELQKPSVLRAEPVDGWYDPKMKVDAFFWRRYREYLSRIKNWPEEVIQAIDHSTDEILKSLANPKETKAFDKRGLVLGYVQSGKTANFTGLINKSYDLGYKLVIVLSGMHNDLRAQTQLRLEEEVVGNQLDINNKPAGVAQIMQNDSEHIIETWTSVDNDISAGSSFVRNLNQPTLMVVKKNSKVLEELRTQLEYQCKISPLDIPVLVVDDEADQASVDTADRKKGEDPKTINRLIRGILEVFPRKCYVGYTATPFANLLIDVKARTENEGPDLYPKDFLIGLPKPSEYCGPEEFFNVEEDADDPRPDLIRYLMEEDTKLFTDIRKKDDADKIEAIPPQMEEAIFSFLIAVSIRHLRGHQSQHNSMLIHTSRFKDVQSSVKDMVSEKFEEIVNQISFNPTGHTVAEIRDLYERDFRETSVKWPGDAPVFDWDEIYKVMKQVAKKIQVFEINGNSKDTLDYHKYKGEGLYVIAVGGDKLSRGLTLEGLTITYYYRNTLMYDTLMQMGRWFGYRKGYVDLCRIYTSEEIASNFSHLAIAMKELRDEFDNLVKSNLTPMDYAIRMLSHPTMTLTNPLKMRNAVFSHTNYEASLQQTRLFYTTERFFRRNMEATERLVNHLLPKFSVVQFGGLTRYHVAEHVEVDQILTFLSDYETHKNASKVDAKRIADYIRLVNEQGELTDWTVAVVEGDPRDRKGIGQYPVKIGNLKVSTAVARGVRLQRRNTLQDRIDIQAIVAAGQESIDLNVEQIKSLNGKQAIKAIRPKERGLLLIYPLHPEVPLFKSLPFSFGEKLVPIGIALSFPSSMVYKKSAYQINKTVRAE